MRIFCVSGFIQRWGTQGGSKISFFVSKVNIFVSEIRMRMWSELKISLCHPRDRKIRS